MNPEHLAILRSGVENWNQWRNENLKIVPDLSEAYLRGLVIDKVKLWRANLQGADLRGSTLREASLWGANLRGANLHRANLREADLYDANLRGADLWGADLQEAKLWRANLRKADLYDADLRGADLREANLQWASLQDANLQEACLESANLQEVRFQRAYLQGVDFRYAIFEDTTYDEGVPISKEPIQIVGLRPFVIIFDEHMMICRELHSFEEWKNFTDEEIDKMDEGALEFWREHKKMLLAIGKNR